MSDHTNYPFLARRLRVQRERATEINFPNIMYIIENATLLEWGATLPAILNLTVSLFLSTSLSRTTTQLVQFKSKPPYLVDGTRRRRPSVLRRGSWLRQYVTSQVLNVLGVSLKIPTQLEGCLTVHLPHEIKWRANLMQLGNFIDVFLARHVSGTYAYHQEH